MKTNELSCKDLMIGDWVMVNPISYYQVKQIRVEFGELRIYLKDTEVFATENEIMPVPLTSEILEKNGFKRDPLWHHCDKDLDNYSISVQLGYANRIEYIKIAEKGKDNVIPSERTKLYLTHIKYVHQIQQALRLCGIDKTIEL